MSRASRRTNFSPAAPQPLSSRTLDLSISNQAMISEMSSLQAFEFGVDLAMWAIRQRDLEQAALELRAGYARQAIGRVLKRVDEYAMCSRCGSKVPKENLSN